MHYRRIAAILCILALAGLRPTLAQQTTPWPLRLDALEAAPESHRVLFANERVRVLEVVLMPGEREPVHTHSRPSLMFVMQPAKLRYFSATVSGDDTQLGPGQDSPGGPQPSGAPASRWLQPEGPHAVENLDSKEFRALRVELLDAPDTPAQDPRWPEWLDAMAAAPESHRIMLENSRVRVLEVVVRPGESEAVHAHPWPSLMFITHPAKLRYTPAIVLGKDVQLGASEIATFGPKPAGIPEPRWLPPEGPHAVRNIDKTDYRALRVEIKP